MKYMNQDKKYMPMNLQFFAEGGDGDGSDNAGDGDTDQDNNSGDDGEGEKTFTQADIDKAVKERLARERRKWEKAKETKKDDTDNVDTKGADKDILAKAEKAEILETKLLCYEQGVNKDSVDDVVALAKAYVNDDTDIEDAIEKVLKKYPQFKSSTKDDEEETETKSWGQRQKGQAKKVDPVEEAFLKRNPDIKL